MIINIEQRKKKKENSKKKATMFTKQEKEKIRHAIEKVIKNPKSSKTTWKTALIGMYGHKKESMDPRTLFDAIQNNQDPIIHDDSTSGWMHQAVSKFGLTVGEIRSMKFGEKMNVLLMDRNVGDYTSGLKKSNFNPLKLGFSYATYIHGENLTGILHFYKLGVKHVPFTWEINVGALPNNTLYWGGIECCAKLKEENVDNKILVGWRGPAINMKHLSHLPKRIKLYNTWWDDYGVSKYSDWLHKK
jgi:hypothetical protein